MTGRAIGLGTMMVLAASVAAGRAHAPAKPERLTADGVIKLWSPNLKSADEYGQIGGSPKQAPNVAAYSFRVSGPTLEELWNHYAGLCGMTERYSEKSFLNATGTGPKGSYVVSDRASGDGKGGRGPTVFLLKTDAYTVSVTFQAESGGKSISGSLTAVVP